MRAFPPTDLKLTVSGKGGGYPSCRRDGVELFYLSHEGELFSDPVRWNASGPPFGEPQFLFRVQAEPQRLSYPYDAAPDGQRFLVLVGTAQPNALTVLLGWKPTAIK